MQQQRTVLGLTRDGSILLVREQLVGVSGSAKQRRKKERGGIIPAWNVKDRVITRSLDALPAKAETWLRREKESSEPIAAQNEHLAAEYAQAAQKLVEEFDQQQICPVEKPVEPEFTIYEVVSDTPDTSGWYWSRPGYRRVYPATVALSGPFATREAAVAAATEALQ